MNKSKLFMLVSITILVVVVVISGTTYAWYVWSSSEEEETKIVTNLGIATVYYDDGKNIEGVKIKPVETKEEGIVKRVSINTDEEMDFNLSFNLYLDILELDEGLKEESFKYALYKDDTIVKEGNFSSESLETDLVECTTNNTNHIILLSDETITTTVSNYTLYIWIDGTMPIPATMQNKNFSFKLHADGQNAVLDKRETIAEYITNLYTNANKTTVTNNSITYNYASSISLMNDRLGGTTSDYNAGNIRYYGASPNNYIYFNCSDYANQSDTTCEKWRIIGVFDGKVKIIRNESIGSYSWDTSASSINDGWGINEWSQADIMKLLNSGYESETVGGSLYWNRESGTCYSGTSNATKSCNFTSVGLINDTTRNMIEEVTWNLGGYSSNLEYSNDMYRNERGTTVRNNPSDGVTRTTEWTGKVALAYPSDYGYAADFSSCSKQLSDYSDATCTSVNWMKTIFGTGQKWLLTPESSTAVLAWHVYGGVNAGYEVYRAFEVFPVLYLNSELKYGSGNGSTSNPYRLSVS